jgi:hypothetical protein
VVNLFNEACKIRDMGHGYGGWLCKCKNEKLMGCEYDDLQNSSRLCMACANVTFECEHAAMADAEFSMQVDRRYLVGSFCISSEAQS